MRDLHGRKTKKMMEESLRKVQETLAKSKSGGICFEYQCNCERERRKKRAKR